MTLKKTFKSLPDHWTADCSKLEAFADDKIYVNQKVKSLSRGVENIVGKGENAGYQLFLLFLQCFQKLSFQGDSVGIVW